MTDGARAEALAPKILIIEDDPSGAQLLVTLLELEGYQPCQIENWKEPLQDVEKHRPSMVLMDVRLRNGNGFDVLDQIRTHPDPEVAGIPVLMMSAEDHKIQSGQSGANGFLLKPFELPSFFNIVREVEEGELSDN